MLARDPTTRSRSPARAQIPADSPAPRRCPRRWPAPPAREPPGVDACALGGYATKYCLAVTVTPTGRGTDALRCLQPAISQAQHILELDDLRADRGVMDIVDAAEHVIGQAPAPIAVVSDNGPCFRGQTFQSVFNADDPLLRHVRTRVKSPQTNGVIERFSGSVKYEHLSRGYIGDGDALDMEAHRFQIIYHTIRPHQTLADHTPKQTHLNHNNRPKNLANS